MPLLLQDLRPLRSEQLLVSLQKPGVLQRRRGRARALQAGVNGRHERHDLAVDAVRFMTGCGQVCGQDSPRNVLQKKKYANQTGSWLLRQSSLRFEGRLFCALKQAFWTLRTEDLESFQLADLNPLCSGAAHCDELPT